MADGELRKIFRAHLRGWDLTAIETGVTTSGVPDLNGCKNGIEFWCEMKRADHWRTTIRPMQIGWCERRLVHGGRVFCAVRRAETELWMFHASQMRFLLDQRVDALPNLGHWGGGAANWDWVAIEDILLGRVS
jgi:hypothetical protein